MLYIPGNNPAMLQQGGIYGADGVLLDLEDAVALNQKDAARILIRNVLKTVNFYNTEVTVRVNHLDTPFGIHDLEEIVPLQPSAIRYPKAESIADLERLINEIERIEDEHGLPHDKMKIHAMIETALGVQNVFEIASFSKRIDCITIGGQDLTADMNVVKTKEGWELDFARKRIVMAAKANKIDVLDTVFADVDDEEGLITETKHIKALGFSGKAVINPRQISAIHKVFTPTEKEIRKEIRIVNEFNRNKEAGIGVFAIDGKMIDAPVVARAQYILDVSGIDVNNM